MALSPDPNISFSQPHPLALGPRPVPGATSAIISIATKMAKPFIALEATATSWVGRQGSGLLLHQGFIEKPASTAPTA